MKEERITALPQWYWHSGLHDAIIEKKTVRHPSAPELHHNCMELQMDAQYAMFDTTVRAIRFYNYKELGGDGFLDGWIWKADRIRRENGKYVLEIDLMQGMERKTYVIRFTDCSVIRRERQ